MGVEDCWLIGRRIRGAVRGLKPSHKATHKDMGYISLICAEGYFRGWKGRCPPIPALFRAFHLLARHLHYP